MLVYMKVHIDVIMMLPMKIQYVMKIMKDNFG